MNRSTLLLVRVSSWRRVHILQGLDSFQMVREQTVHQQEREPYCIHTFPVSQVYRELMVYPDSGIQEWVDCGIQQGRVIACHCCNHQNQPSVSVPMRDPRLSYHHAWESLMDHRPVSHREPLIFPVSGCHPGTSVSRIQSSWESCHLLPASVSDYRIHTWEYVLDHTSRWRIRSVIQSVIRQCQSSTCQP